MKRISSRATYFHKRVFPVFWFGGLAAMILVLLVTRGADANDPIIAGPIFMAVIGYVLMRLFIFDLADEVWDAGDYLVFKNKGLEEMVRLENIIKVTASIFVNPPRVTVMLQTPSRLGKRITFIPLTPFTLNPCWKSPIIDELIQRVDKARSR